MSEKNYFFVISFPRDELIEYTTKLNSYISKLFPGKTNPFTLKPLEIMEEDAVVKITIRATEREITDFARRFFGASYELREREDGEVEIVQTDHIDQESKAEGVTKH